MPEKNLFHYLYNSASEPHPKKSAQPCAAADSSSLWHPILDDKATLSANRLIQEIAAYLARHRESDAPCLADGDAGIALFFAYLGRAQHFSNADTLAVDYLNGAIHALAESTMLPDLFGGIAGIAWVAEHIQSLGHTAKVGELNFADEAEHISADDDDLNADIDAYLAEFLSQGPWFYHYDLVSGLVGFGVYFFQRPRTALRKSALEKILDHLELLAVKRKAGFAWHTPSGLLTENERARFPDGYWNLGLAHGAPGVIWLLSQFIREGLFLERVKPLLEGAVAWFLKQKLTHPFSAASPRFPYWLAPYSSLQPSRLGWCYGDLGLVFPLFSAAHGLDNSTLHAEALSIALNAAQVRGEAAKVVDGGLCHGAAGVAHLFNRLYHATGLEAFAEAARYWFQILFALRRPGQGLLGFAAEQRDPSGQVILVPQRGFLTGIAGIALALVGATTSIEPRWDDILLTALPPGSLLSSRGGKGEHTASTVMGGPSTSATMEESAAPAVKRKHTASTDNNG